MIASGWFVTAFISGLSVIAVIIKKEMAIIALKEKEENEKS